jgi:hypothetical protein
MRFTVERLKTIKTEISNLPYISFEEYFQDYVMKVQDSNIDNEMSFFINHNFMSYDILSSLITDSGKELKQL